MSDSDAIHVACPKCRKKLRVKATAAGEKVRCPDKACAALIAVPALAQAEAVAPPRRAATARWPWIAGCAAALVLAVVFVVVAGLGIWALNRSARANGLTKEGLGGSTWEGKSTDGVTIELIFTETYVTVAVLRPGIDLAKGREAAKWASGNVVRGLAGGGLVIGNAGYEIDAAKKAVKIDSAIARLNEDGTLVLAGEIQLGNSTVKIPETKLERMAPNAAKAEPRVQPAETGLFAAWAGEWAESKLGHDRHPDAADTSRRVPRLLTIGMLGGTGVASPAPADGRRRSHVEIGDVADGVREWSKMIS